MVTDTDKTEAIIEKSTELFMRYGIKSISMDEIAKEIGISKKTLYALVDNKKGLVRDVIQKHLKEDEESIQNLIRQAENAIDEMAKIAGHVTHFLREMKPTLIYDLKKYHRDSWDIVEQRHFSFIHSTIKNNIERGINEGLYKSNLSPEIIARFYAKISECAVDENIFPTKKFTHMEVYLQHLAYHMHGISTERGKQLLEKIELEK